MINLLECGHRHNGRVAVRPGMPPLALQLHRMPGLHDILCNPHGQTSPLHQRSVILTPVAETILCLGLLVLHTSRILTIRLRDYFCNKAIEEGEKLLLIFLKALFVVNCYFTLILARGKLFVETLHENFMLAQKMRF